MFKKPSNLTILIVGFFTIAGQEYTGPTVTPEKLCRHDEVTITEPTGYGLSLAVRTAESSYLYLADIGGITVVPNYWVTHSVSLKVKDLIGIAYINGQPYVRPVFSKLGIYEFYFAKNLETERENTIAFTRYVEYLGDNHPDCANEPNAKHEPIR